MPRLTEAAKAVAGVSATKALFSLLGTVLDFADSCSPGDDMTLLVLRRQAIAKAQNRIVPSKVSAPVRRLGSASQPELFRQGD